DGIRDGHVTGVQTCALPICHFPSRHLGHVQHALYPGPRRRRSQPRARDLRGDLRLPARQRGCRARDLGTLLDRETALQVRHALTALLRFGLLLPFRGGTFLRGALLGLALLLGLLRLSGLQFRRLLLGGAALLGRRSFRLSPLLLAARPFLRRRWWWSERLLRLLGRRRGGGRRGLRRRLHRASHGARIDHGCLDRQRRRRGRR